MSFILFVVSGIVILFLIIHKQVEVVYGRGLIMKSMGIGLDRWLHARLASFMVFVHMLSFRNIIRALNLAFVFITRIFLALGSFIGKGIREIIIKFAHKQGNTNNSGSASFYLKQIKENRDNTYPSVDKTEKGK